MTKNEAADYISAELEESEDMLDKDAIQAYSMSVDALRVQQQREENKCANCGIDLGPVYCPKCYKAVHGELENKPLTLDELKEMDGEPVWCAISNRNGVVGIKETHGVKKVVIGFNYGWEWAEDVLQCSKGGVYRYKPEV